MCINANIFKEFYMKNPVEGVSIQFEDEDGWKGCIEISDITAKPKGMGLGTKAMKRIIDIADKTGIVLKVMPAGNPGSTKFERLREWYERLGFSGNDLCETMYYGN